MAYFPYAQFLILLCVWPSITSVCAYQSNAGDNCSRLPHFGLHAQDDLAKRNIKEGQDPEHECCIFCMNTTGCVAWTLNENHCRAKGPRALNRSVRVPCESCVSGFRSPLPPAPAPAPSPPPAPLPKDPKNVLLIVVDDLRPQMGCYGQNETVTPHIDEFAKGSTVFLNAYCQQAVCSPSRNSVIRVRVRV